MSLTTIFGLVASFFIKYFLIILISLCGAAVLFLLIFVVYSIFKKTSDTTVDTKHHVASMSKQHVNITTGHKKKKKLSMYRDYLIPPMKKTNFQWPLFHFYRLDKQLHPELYTSDVMKSATGQQRRRTREKT